MNRKDFEFYFFIFLGFIGILIIYLIKENFSNPKLVNIIFIMPFLFILTPYFIYKLFQNFIITKKIESVPRFLRDVVDSSLSGFDIISSIKQTKKNDYGYLKKDVKNFANLLSWGVSFNKALTKFALLVKNDIFIRDVDLIIRTRKIGANITNVLKEIAEKIEKDISRKKALKSSLFSNTITSYISYVLFLIIMIIIFNSLFLGDGTSALNISKTFSNTLLSIFILLCYEISILSGFLFGFMQDNSFSSGIIHVIILTLITFLSFFIAI